MISIIVRTVQFRGDHEADIGVAMHAIDGETVADLVRRAKMCPEQGDYIEIRLLVEQRN